MSTATLRIVVPWVAASLAWGCRAEPPVSSAGRPNIVLVTLCDWRADHSDVFVAEHKSTPTLTRLAAQGVAFEQAFAASNTTRASVASVLTGTSPTTHGLLFPVGHVAGDVPTLARLLGEQGYVTAALVQGSEPTDIGLDSGLLADFGAVRTTTADSEWWPGQLKLDLTGQPFFAYVHISHVERFPSSGDASPFAPEVDPRIEAWATSEAAAGWPWGGFGPVVATDPSLRVGYVNLYNAALSHADRMLDDLIKSLGKAGLLDGSVVVVTGDHGESLGEGGFVRYGAGLGDDQLRVPLVIYAPGAGNGVRVDDVVGHVDLAPTVLELAGVAVPSKVEGRSLVPLLRGQSRPTAPVLSQAVDFSTGRLLQRVSQPPYALQQLEGTGEWRAVEQIEGVYMDVSGKEPAGIVALRDWLKVHGAPEDYGVR